MAATAPAETSAASSAATRRCAEVNPRRREGIGLLGSPAWAARVGLRPSHTSVGASRRAQLGTHAPTSLRAEMTEEPRDPSNTQVHRVGDPSATRVASYLAQPDEVGRVLLLY